MTDDELATLIAALPDEAVARLVVDLQIAQDVTDAARENGYALVRHVETPEWDNFSLVPPDEYAIVMKPETN